MIGPVTVVVRFHAAAVATALFTAFPSPTLNMIPISALSADAAMLTVPAGGSRPPSRDRPPRRTCVVAVPAPARGVLLPLLADGRHSGPLPSSRTCPLGSAPAARPGAPGHLSTTDPTDINGRLVSSLPRVRRVARVGGCFGDDHPHKHMRAEMRGLGYPF